MQDPTAYEYDCRADLGQRVNVTHTTGKSLSCAFLFFGVGLAEMEVMLCGMQGKYGGTGGKSAGKAYGLSCRPCETKGCFCDCRNRMLCNLESNLN